MKTNVPVADLDRIAAHVDASIKAARAAQRLLTATEAEAATLAAQAAEEAGRALTRLGALGAKAPELPSPSSPKPIPSHLLSTPTSRSLLKALHEVMLLAERVDAERGRVRPAHDALQPGESRESRESRGVDLAQSIGEIAARVRREVQGTNPADGTNPVSDPGDLGDPGRE